MEYSTSQKERAHMENPEILIRDAEWSDLKKIIQIFGPNSELQAYKEDRYSDSGEKIRCCTSFPEDVWVAEYDRDIVGFLHFFTSCSEGYEREILSLQTAPSLSREKADEVKKKLQEALLHLEP